MTSALDTLISAAILAPSGDNTQPWRFEVDESEGTIAVFVDETRDSSPMNAGQRMARIAVGGAIENILQAAEANRWDCEVLRHAIPASLTIRVAAGAVSSGEIPASIEDRLTNRKAYTARPIPAIILAQLEQVVSPSGRVGIRWIVDGRQLRTIATICGRSDAILFNEPSMLRAFLGQVRFRSQPIEVVQEGLSTGSLELSGFQRFSLSLLANLSGPLASWIPIGRVIGAKTSQLIAASAGLCLIEADDRSPATDFYVGQAMQRAWLALTQHGIAAQPMMSLPVLDNALEHGTSGLIESLCGDRVQALLDRFAEATSTSRKRPAAILRFGYSDPPTARTGRRPPQAVTTRVSSYSEVVPVERRA